MANRHSNMLSRRKKRQRERECAALPPISPDEFALLSNQGQATPEHARSCVYHLANDLQIKPLSERDLNSEAGHVGGRVLHWPWSQDMNVRDELSLDRSFVGRLCYFLVAETREDNIWTWLLHELKNEKRDVDLPGRHRVSGIMDAQFVLSNFFLPPLRTLERALNDFSGKHLKSMVVAATACGIRMIKSTTAPPYDPALCTALISANNINAHGIMRANTEAMIMLYHPTKPNGKLFLDIAPRYLQFGTKLLRTPAVEAFSFNALRSAYILRLQNDEKGAAWLEDVVKSRFPTVWGVRQRWLRRYETDPKLEGLRRQSTSRPTFDSWN